MKIISAPSVPTKNSTLRRLQKFLEFCEINYRAWEGNGTCRSVRDLHEYLNKDQVTFRQDHFSPPILDVEVSVILVYCDWQGQIRELYEEKQVMRSTGATLRRTTFNGVGETVRQGETPLEASFRGLKEELISFEGEKLFADRSKFVLNSQKVEIWQPRTSEKWPPILASYHRSIFLCEISPEIFRKEGYHHFEKGRDIYFKWRPVRVRQT